MSAASSSEDIVVPKVDAAAADAAAADAAAHTVRRAELARDLRLADYLLLPGKVFGAFGAGVARFLWRFFALEYLVATEIAPFFARKDAAAVPTGGSAFVTGTNMNFVGGTAVYSPWARYAERALGMQPAAKELSALTPHCCAFCLALILGINAAVFYAIPLGLAAIFPVFMAGVGEVGASIAYYAAHGCGYAVVAGLALIVAREVVWTAAAGRVRRALEAAADIRLRAEIAASSPPELDPTPAAEDAETPGEDEVVTDAPPDAGAEPAPRGDGLRHRPRSSAPRTQD